MRCLIPLMIGLVCVSVDVRAEEAPAAVSMAAAAKALVDALPAEQKDQIHFAFDAPERFQWHFVPGPRPGVSLLDMTDDQRALALDVVRAGLSEQGFKLEEDIRSLDQVLRDMGGGPERNPLLYYVMIFGDPEAEGTWAYRLEGHHLSLHWTIVKGQLSLNLPQFLGSNPAEVREGPKTGLRVLAAQEDLAWQIVRSLDEAQRAKAIIAEEAPSDFLTGHEREIQMTDHVGLPYDELNTEQQGILINLVESYARVQLDKVADDRLKRVQDSLGSITFAWMGGLEAGVGHYYRIQGDRFIIEFDNIQNNANHVHTVWRDVDGDFGEDLLKEHYEQHEHDAEHGHDQQ